MRLDKFLSNLKYGTRKEVTNFVRRGYVTVNGEKVSKASISINPETDKVVFNDEVVFYKESILLMLHKPQGYICAHSDGLHKTIFELVNEPYDRLDLHIAGRLDVDTEGLILLTNDGNLLHDIISPKKNVYKKYYVEVESPFEHSKLLKPMTIQDGRSYDYVPNPPLVETINETSLYLSINEGKFHQVKRMIEHCGSEVTYLRRESIGNLQLGDLEKGLITEVQKKDLFE